MRDVGAVSCAVALTGLLAGCGGTDRPGGGGPLPDRCTAAALGIPGVEAPSYRLPPGCALAVTHGADAIVATVAEAETVITCPPGTARDLDLPREGVIARQALLSPAGTGFRLFDDGATLTFVSLQRSPCPGDPLPMPTPAAFAWRINAPSTPRTIASATCTVAAPPCH